MSEDRAADIMYSPLAPSSEPAASAPTRVADEMYGPSKREAPAPQVVAKANIAKTAAEKMYETPPKASEIPSAESAAEGEQPQAAPGDQHAEADQAPVQMLAITETMQLRAPEGFGEWDQGALDTLAPVVERYGIEKDDVQGLLDMHVAALRREGNDAMNALLQIMTTEHDARVAGWRHDCDRDPELIAYGRENARSDGAEVLRRYFSPSFRATLKEYGLLSHPEFVKGLLGMRAALRKTEQQLTDLRHRHLENLGLRSRPGDFYESRALATSLKQDAMRAKGSRRSKL